uniref:Uncharacterized protein n=1 Tax=Cacopsylla melanoneura TaxID=428564 RepID=A0A8D8Z035_9HEMI
MISVSKILISKFQLRFQLVFRLPFEHKLAKRYRKRSYLFWQPCPIVSGCQPCLNETEKFCSIKNSLYLYLTVHYYYQPKSKRIVVVNKVLCVFCVDFNFNLCLFINCQFLNFLFREKLEPIISKL